MKDEDRDQLRAQYLQKRPGMGDLAQATTTSMLVIEVERYDIIERFQNVTQVYPEGSE